MCEKIDLITTATIRPKILEKTYSSFKKNLFKDWPFRVIINIDPVGETNKYNANDVLDVVRKYFGNDIKYRKSDTPHFSRAMIWLWEQVQTEYFFNLEDDWELREEVDSFPKMIRTMDKYPRLALLRMQFRDSDETTAQLRARLWPRGVWNGDYYVTPDLQYTGAPSLIRKEFITFMSQFMTPADNHEVAGNKAKHRGKRLGIYWEYGGYGKPNVKKELIKNIGHEWRRKHGFGKRGRKKRDGAWFWEKVN